MNQSLAGILRRVTTLSAYHHYSALARLLGPVRDVLYVFTLQSDPMRLDAAQFFRFRFFSWNGYPAKIARQMVLLLIARPHVLPTQIRPSVDRIPWANTCNEHRRFVDKCLLSQKD